MTARIRIVIADDHLLMRRGLRLTLEEVSSDFQLVGEASDGQSLLELVEQAPPDVVLMDPRMPKVDGLQALERINASWPGIAVVMLTAHDDDELIVRAIRSGRPGTCSKTAICNNCSTRCALPRAVTCFSSPNWRPGSHGRGLFPPPRRPCPPAPLPPLPVPGQC